jgi:hypothetical protein
VRERAPPRAGGHPFTFIPAVGIVVVAFGFGLAFVIA